MGENLWVGDENAANPAWEFRKTWTFIYISYTS